jgi:hypothetical protein
LEDPGAGERILLKWNVKQGDRGAWAGLIWLRQGQGLGSCE